MYGNIQHLWTYKCTRVRDEPYTVITHTYICTYTVQSVACSSTQVVSRYLNISRKLINPCCSEGDVKKFGIR